MTKAPLAGPQTEGRTLGTDWSIENVAKLLRSNAQRGEWNSSAAGGSMAAINQAYLRKVSARHLPTFASVIFMRLDKPASLYLSLCFANDEGYLPWNAEAAELWLTALFGEDRSRAREEAAGNPSVRQFTL